MSELRDEWLADIARTGQAYRNEVRAMADELIELRRRLNNEQAPELGSLKERLRFVRVGDSIGIPYADGPGSPGIHVRRFLRTE